MFCVLLLVLFGFWLCFAGFVVCKFQFFLLLLYSCSVVTPHPWLLFVHCSQPMVGPCLSLFLTCYSLPIATLHLLMLSHYRSLPIVAFTILRYLCPPNLLFLLLACLWLLLACVPSDGTPCLYLFLHVGSGATNNKQKLAIKVSFFFKFIFILSLLKFLILV